MLEEGTAAKAHRRYKHEPSEHGFMACQLDTAETVPGDPDSQIVYVNLVGTLAYPVPALVDEDSRMWD